jgi:hypothetical protein
VGYTARARCADRQRKSRDREQRERTAPAESEPQSAGEQNRTAHVAERTCERPARHVARTLRIVEIHQRRLRETDERAGRRIPDHERDEQRHETERDGRKRCRDRKSDSAGDKQQPSPRRVAEDADQRIERAPDEARNREHETDLRIAQRQVVANEWPCGRARTPDELVEELDRKQEDDDAGDSAPAEDPELAGRPCAVHRSHLTHVARVFHSANVAICSTSRKTQRAHVISFAFRAAIRHHRTHLLSATSYTMRSECDVIMSDVSFRSARRGELIAA